jgi:hypothetical protein
VRRTGILGSSPNSSSSVTAPHTISSANNCMASVGVNLPSAKAFVFASRESLIAHRPAHPQAPEVTSPSGLMNPASSRSWAVRPQLAVHLLELPLSASNPRSVDPARGHEEAGDQGTTLYVESPECAKRLDPRTFIVPQTTKTPFTRSGPHMWLTKSRY